jgi:hypothetical protein
MSDAKIKKLTLLFGFRKGEGLGILISEVNLDEAIIRVTGQVQTIGTETAPRRNGLHLRELRRLTAASACCVPWPAHDRLSALLRPTGNRGRDRGFVRGSWGAEGGDIGDNNAQSDRVRRRAASRAVNP